MSGPIIIVDGYNLMNEMIREGLEGAELGDFRYKMLRELDRYRVQTGKYRIWVVFDGRPLKGEGKPHRKAGSVGIFFSKTHASADDTILEKCRSNPGKVILVTSDGKLRRNAEAHVVKSIGSGYFLRRYLSTGKGVEES